jgi:hypothetical protein
MIRFLKAPTDTKVITLAVSISFVIIIAAAD